MECKYDELKNNHEKLKKEYEELNNSHEKLKNDYEKLTNDYEKLKIDYSENTIIESMNSMKIQYEELLETTVSKYRYKKAYEKWHRLYKINNACSIVLEHCIKSFKILSEKFIYGGPNRTEMDRIRLELSLVKNILEDDVHETEYHYTIDN